MPSQYTITAEPSSDADSGIVRTAHGSVTRSIYPSTVFADPVLTAGSITIRASTTLGPNTTSSTQSAAQYNYTGARGVKLYCNVSVAQTSGTGQLNVVVQEQDELSGNWINSTGLVFAGTTTVATRVLTFYPGIAETANFEASAAVPVPWRTSIDVSSSLTGAVTFSISARYIA